MDVNGQNYKVEYLPGDSDSGLFGGNSNWRGPIWMAPNFLLVESLLRCYMFYGNTFKVECPHWLRRYDAPGTRCRRGSASPDTLDGQG